METSRATSTYTISLMTLSGEITVLSPMPAEDTVRDVQRAIRAQLQMPISVQMLVWVSTALRDASKILGTIFGPTDAPVLNLLRRPFTPAERAELHKRLVRAAAAGKSSEVRELLREGAQVNFEPVADTDISISLSHWDEILEDSAGQSDAAEGSCQTVSQMQEPRAAQDILPNLSAKQEVRANEEASEEEEMMDKANKCEVLPAPGHPCGGLSPLLVALVSGHEEITRDLRELGAHEIDLQANLREDYQTQREEATRKLKLAFSQADFMEVVKALAHGAAVDVYMPRGRALTASLPVWSIWPGSAQRFGTPLHACAAMHEVPGAFETAQILIALKADLNAGDAEGDSPLAHARFFEAHDVYALYEGQGALVQGPFFRRHR